jgi:hypothetical protein
MPCATFLIRDVECDAMNQEDSVSARCCRALAHVSARLSETFPPIAVPRRCQASGFPDRRLGARLSAKCNGGDWRAWQTPSRPAEFGTARGNHTKRSFCARTKLPNNVASAEGATAALTKSRRRCLRKPAVQKGEIRAAVFAVKPLSPSVSVASGGPPQPTGRRARGLSIDRPLRVRPSRG